MIRTVPFLAAVVAVVAGGLLEGCSGEVVGAACGKAGNCGANASCLADGADKVCRCNAGFSGDGKTCTKVSEVPAECLACSTDATCVADGSLTRCVCKDGFTGDGTVCEADPTATECGTCGAHARCLRKNGSPVCLCESGYYGDGQTCTKPADCDEQHGACHAFATCTMSAGPVCACTEPFGGDGYECSGPVSKALRVKAKLTLKVTGSCGAAGTFNGEVAWEADVPLLLNGGKYSGTKTQNIWDLTSEVVIDPLPPGETTVALDLKTNADISCLGRKEFRMTAIQGAGAKKIPVNGNFLGSTLEWFITPPNDGVTYTVRTQRAGAETTDPTFLTYKFDP